MTTKEKTIEERIAALEAMAHPPVCFYEDADGYLKCSSPSADYKRGYDDAKKGKPHP